METKPAEIQPAQGVCPLLAFVKHPDSPTKADLIRAYENQLRALYAWGCDKEKVKHFSDKVKGLLRGQVGPKQAANITGSPALSAAWKSLGLHPNRMSQKNLMDLEGEI